MNFKIGFLTLITSFVISEIFDTKADFRPPGTVEIVDTFFYDATEINNGDWREYLSYLEVNEGKDSDIYKYAVPDTTVWEIEVGFNSPFVETYFSHPSYTKYPVVGVTQKQAMDYCTWRTHAVKLMLKENDFDGPKDLKYRLPSKYEWALIANAGYDKKSKKIQQKHLVQLKNAGYNSSTLMEAHMKYEDRDRITSDGFNSYGYDVIAKDPVSVKALLPNKLGVYNIYGNVAEMVIEPGVAMGGSYDHFYEDIVPTNKEIKYDGPQKWLGFRCVCEVTQK